MAKSKVTQQDAIEEGRVTETASATKYSLQAFIAAPPATDTSVLREELDRRGIYAYELNDVASAGRSLTELIDESVRRADLVVVVLGGERRDNVLVELGFALALKKRVLALVPPGTELPVEPVPSLRTKSDNREAIDFGLTQLLAAPGPSRPGKKDRLPGTKPLGPIADELLRKFQAAADHPDEQQEAMGIA
jgi:nucleoside 2-deoxyribosyltransferase